MPAPSVTERESAENGTGTMATGLAVRAKAEARGSFRFFAPEMDKRLRERWALQHELPVIPKSTHRERIEENAQIFDFMLSDEDMTELDALDTTGGTDRALERKWW